MNLSGAHSGSSQRCSHCGAEDPQKAALSFFSPISGVNANLFRLDTPLHGFMTPGPLLTFIL